MFLRSDDIYIEFLAFTVLQIYIPELKMLSVNAHSKRNLESQLRAPTKFGRCWWLPYYVQVYEVRELS